jgi:hypothetical protein
MKNVKKIIFFNIYNKKELYNLKKILQEENEND